MIPIEIRRMYDILVSFLGNSKNGLDDTYQLQFSCPKCQDRDGIQERHKFHLEVNLTKGLYHCWKCSSIDEGMQGSVYSLIRKYGNPQLLKEYKEAINEFKKTSLYELKFSKEDFQGDYEDMEDEGVMLPKGYVKLQKGISEDTRAFRYLQERGVGWPVIEDFHIGFTGYSSSDKSVSNRVILPSFNEYGELNYWTGRDFTGNEKRQRYYNPKVDRKSIIFNEDKVVWNADITLVEGPFDSIVVPNSIPLLGKQLNDEYKLYHSLFKRANANILLWTDNDAIETARFIYRSLNQGRLKNRIKIIEPIMGKDPSEIYQKYGYRGIISCLSMAKRIAESELYFKKRTNTW